MTEFCLIHDMIVACDGPCGNGTGNHTGGTYPFKQPQIINFFGTVSCILWLQGFILLMYWNIYEVPPAFLSVLAVAFKIVASCFFNVQPASGLLMQVPLGVKWSNFVGICLFHTGMVWVPLLLFKNTGNIQGGARVCVCVWGGCRFAGKHVCDVYGVCVRQRDLKRPHKCVRVV